MKYHFICICFFLCAKTYSQNEELPRIEKDTLFTTFGFKIIDGMDLQLGNGTMPNGDFKYASLSTRGWNMIGSPQYPLTRKLNGHKVKVKKFRKEGNKKTGYGYVIVIGMGVTMNGEVDIENAIAAGEVIVPDEFKPKVAGQVSQLSVGDEIKKLKDLFDSGAITQDEYDAGKKKLLGQ